MLQFPEQGRKQSTFYCDTQRHQVCHEFFGQGTKNVHLYRDERPEPSRSRPEGNTTSLPFQGKEMNFPWKGKQIFSKKAGNSEFFL